MKKKGTHLDQLLYVKKENILLVQNRMECAIFLITDTIGI